MTLLRYAAIVLTLLLFQTKATQAYQPFTKEVWLNETQTPVSVNCIAEDTHGYIWLGTEEGIYRYNGKSFLKIGNSNTAVTALTISDGHIWAGFDNGQLGVIINDSVYFKQLKGAIPDVAISSIYIITDNIYIIGTYGQGVYLFANSYGRQYSTDNHLTDNYTYKVLSPDSGMILIATDQGINEARYDKNKKLEFSNYTSAHNLPDNIVKTIEQIPGSCWSWIGTHQGGLALFCSMKKTIWVPAADKDWSWGQVNDILAVDKQNAWVTTNSGYLLKVTIQDSLHIAISPYHYPDKKLRHLLIDETGNIWCATNSGLQLFTAHYMMNMPVDKPYNLSSLTAIECDKENNIWMALKERLYTKTSDDDKPTLSEVMKSSVSDIYNDKNNNLWIGTFGDGIWLKKGNNASYKVTTIPTLLKESVLDINGRNGYIWVTGLNGIHQLSHDGNTTRLIKTHNKSTGVGSDYVYETYTTDNNTTWMATDGAGVCRYENGNYKLWDSAAGMVSKVIYNVTGDTKGNIWASTLDNGLLKYNGNKWESLDDSSGLYNINISTIAANNAGQIITVHKEGIDIWHPSSKQFRHIGKRSGLGIDSVSEILKLSARDAAGCIYIPYEDGLICFLNQNKNNDIIPRIVINKISTFFNPVPESKTIFTHDDNYLSFDYTGISYSNPEDIYYRYKLEGYNDEWIYTKDESTTFPKLPSGSYVFIVQASNNNSFSAFGETSYSFTVKKPFWLQIWFILLAVIVAWILSYLYIRLRERNLRKVSQLQKERMIFEYEHLKSQVNPHFLFNSLNTLSSLIDDDTETALRYTDQLSDLYRNMLSFKDKDLVYLREELEIIDSYLFIQKSRFGSALHLSTEIADHIRKNKKIIPMAIQLLVENAIKHNIVATNRPLYINISADEHYLTVTNNIQSKISKEKGAGLGLANIRKRYKLLTKKEVAYYIKEDDFIVKIPLL